MLKKFAVRHFGRTFADETFDFLKKNYRLPQNSRPQMSRPQMSVRKCLTAKNFFPKSSIFDQQSNFYQKFNFFAKIQFLIKIRFYGQNSFFWKQLIENGFLEPLS